MLVDAKIKLNGRRLTNYSGKITCVYQLYDNGLFVYNVYNDEDRTQKHACSQVQTQKECSCTESVGLLATANDQSIRGCMYRASTVRKSCQRESVL